MNKEEAAYLEQTILTVFLWIGLWGIINMFFEHYCKSFGTQLFVYIVFVITSFTLLKNRNHLAH